MSIAFFYPLAWLGALAVAVPIWLHLRRREDPHLVRFSALQFLDDQPVARQRRLWPQHWPLLLLRLLALLSLVAAFAWPYWSNDAEILINESRVYVLDNTFSHQASDAFQNARQEIIGQLQAAGPDMQLAVVELTHQPQVLVNFGDSRQDAIDCLQTLQASYQRGSYLEAFRLADRLLRQSLGQQRHIVLLGDSQENQWSEGRSVAPFLENTDVTLPDVTADSAANVALSEPVASRDFGTRPRVKCAVTLFHQESVEPAHVVYRVNGVDVFRREIPLSQQPGSLTLLAEWEAEPTEWVRGYVRLEDARDVLAGDNEVVFSLPPVREGRLGLLARSAFLQTALSPDVMRGRWTTRVLDPADLPLEEQQEAELDVLCVETHYLDLPETRQLVLDFLGSGRGVFLLVDRLTPAITGFLRRLHIDVLPVADRPSGPMGFRYVYLEHPIFRPFRSADFGNLTEISVQAYRRLKIPQAIPLIFSDTGDPLLFELQPTSGKLLVLAFSLVREESDWPLHPTFIPFLDRCLQHVRSEITRQTEFEPGQSCIWKIPAGRDVREIVLRTAGAGQEDVSLSALVADGQARFQVPGTPGLYALCYDDHPSIEGMLAVNPSPLESQLTYSKSPASIEAWKLRSASSSREDESTVLAVQLSEASILRQRLWWWLVIGGLVALATESAYLSIRKALT